jgi:L-lactate dehydrogenase (cytochrome)
MTERQFVMPVTALDYRSLAERHLPRFLFDYIDGGANDERTMAANVADFEAVRLRQRVLRDVSAVDAATTLMGRPAALPMVLAPIGLAGLFARRGEVMAVRAANAAGVPFTLSTVGICSVEEVSAAASQPYWFQLYMMRDRAFIKRLLERVRRSGCDTLVFTVDLAVSGMRHRDQRNGMIGNSLRSRIGKARQLLARPGWLWDVGLRGKPHQFGNIADALPPDSTLGQFKSWIDQQFDPSVSWKDIAWLRRIWDGKLVLKGILDADDARSAADIGADGIVVSNHGGRQLDGVASTVAKLPQIVSVAGSNVEVYLDGGVRSGVDVLKALALGARGVMIGRPWAWAIAGAGEQGLADLLSCFRQELRVAMALTGVTRVGEIDSGVLDR